jgi:hypothetical protein
MLRAITDGYPLTAVPGHSGRGEVNFHITSSTRRLGSWRDIDAVK